MARMRRSGYEPVQARSPLRLRLGLALCGVVWGTAAAVGFALAALPGWAALFAAVGERHPVAASTGVYMVATTATRNPALVLASGVLGNSRPAAANPSR